MPRQKPTRRRPVAHLQSKERTVRGNSRRSSDPHRPREKPRSANRKDRRQPRCVTSATADVVTRSAGASGRHDGKRRCFASVDAFASCNSCIGDRGRLGLTWEVPGPDRRIENNTTAALFSWKSKLLILSCPLQPHIVVTAHLEEGLASASSRGTPCRPPAVHRRSGSGQAPHRSATR